MERRRVRDVLLAVALVLCASAAGLALPRLIPVFATAERWLVDLRVAGMSAPEPQHDRVVVVAVTEDTLAALPYRSPLDRGFLAGLVEALDAAGAAVIAIDSLFDQPTEPEKDFRLRAALTVARAPVVVAWADGDDGLTPRQTAFLKDYLQGVPRGWATLLTDPYDGIPRWIYPGRDLHGRALASFPAAVVAAAGGESGQAVAAEPVPLAFRQPPSADERAFRSFPAHLVPLLPKAWFAGKIVLIGADLPHTDRHRIPLSTVLGNREGSLPGVHIHANAVAQLLDGRIAAAIRPTVEIATVAVAGVGALLIGGINVAASLQIGLGVAFFAGLWFAGFAAYAAWGVLLPLVSPSLAFAFAVAGGNAFWRGRSRRHIRFIEDAFSRFTSPSVVRELVRDPSRLRLGGEKREITCLFTDIAGFTSWVEGSDPEQALSVLNGYLDEMCRIVFAHDGTMNKIIGDALFVFFGAPVAQPDHAARAVACALDLDAFARRFAQAQREQGIPFGDTRVGVHSGVAVVGNFGGDRFFDYTAYGDTVNTTSRLEGANKHIGTLVCVGEATVRQCPDVPFRPIGSIVVVGRSEPIDTYEPLAAGSAATARLAKYLEAFGWMREYDSRAQRAFEDLAEHVPDDALVKFHVARLGRGEGGVVLRLSGK